MAGKSGARWAVKVQILAEIDSGGRASCGAVLLSGDPGVAPGCACFWDVRGTLSWLEINNPRLCVPAYPYS